MQVITGKFRGRKLKTIEGLSTRPTLARVKESLFSIIDDRIANSNVLDLFAGSGAFGIECVSRGAEFCWLVESNISEVKNINYNFRGVENYEVICEDFKFALAKLKNRKVTFDLIFLDPPYDTDYCFEALRLIEKYSLLKDTGLIVFETRAKNDLQNFPKCYTIIDMRKYGIAKLFFLEKIK